MRNQHISTSTMLTMKGQILATVAVMSVAVILSSASFYSSSFSDGGEAATMAALSRVRVAMSLSAKESFGWFYDITDEGWQLMKLRARTAVQYSNPSKPETGYEKPRFWYLNNLQVSRLLSC
jgi:hypothetical protein